MSLSYTRGETAEGRAKEEERAREEEKKKKQQHDKEEGEETLTCD